MALLKKSVEEKGRCAGPRRRRRLADASPAAKRPDVHISNLKFQIGKIVRSEIVADVKFEI